MMTPPIIVKQYFFPFVQVSADPEFEATNDELEIDFQTKVAVDKQPENDTYQVTLEITAAPKDEQHRIPYAIHLIAVGLFLVTKEFDDYEKLLRVNGSSILYSSAREFLITVTSRGPWPPMILPTISFISHETDSAPLKKKRTKRVK